jgi:hypothetical protein
VDNHQTLKSKEKQFLTNMMFPNTAVSNITGIHVCVCVCVCVHAHARACMRVLLYDTVNCYDSIMLLCNNAHCPSPCVPQSAAQTECHVMGGDQTSSYMQPALTVIFTSLDHQPFEEGVKWLPITCTLLTDNSGGRSVFPVSQCTLTIDSSQCERIKQNPRSCTLM